MDQEKSIKYNRIGIKTIGIVLIILAALTLLGGLASGNIVGIIQGTVRLGGTPLSGILIQVADQAGVPVRMVTSDVNGHFRTKLPLTTGLYQLKTEDPKKNYQFKAYQFRIGTEPLKPWLITPLQIEN